MTNQFDKASKESEEKSAFVCVSCGHNNIVHTGNKGGGKTTTQVKDRFTDAVAESSEKSAFVCTSCKQEQPAS